MSETPFDKKLAGVINLDAARYARDEAAAEAAHQRGELFKFECLHHEEFHFGTAEGMVILNRVDTCTGFQLTPDEAEEFGKQLVQCAAIARLEASGVIQYCDDSEDAGSDDAGPAPAV